MDWGSCGSFDFMRTVPRPVKRSKSKTGCVKIKNLLEQLKLIVKKSEGLE